MKFLQIVSVAAAAAAVAVPAAATTKPTPQQRQIAALQRQVKTLNAEVAALKVQVGGLIQQQRQDEDRATCSFAVSQDDINSVWHTLNLLAQYVGFTAQPDFPRYDDQGACQRMGVTRIR